MVFKVSNSMKHPADAKKELSEGKKHSKNNKRPKQSRYKRHTQESGHNRNGEISWDEFRFPPMPGIEDGGGAEYEDGTPSHFSSPKKVSTWHLDLEGMFIIHPGQRKKIDLSKVNTKRKLIQLTNMIKEESSVDARALYISIDNACQYAWSLSLPETLAFSPDLFSWPADLKIDGDDVENDD